MQPIVGDCEDSLNRATVRTDISHIVFHVLARLPGQINKICVLCLLKRMDLWVLEISNIIFYSNLTKLFLEFNELDLESESIESCLDDEDMNVFIVLPGLAVQLS